MPTVASYPHLVAEFDRERNAPYTPESFSYGSARKVWWRCDEGPDHVWQASPNARTHGKGENCPFCAGKRVSVTNSLAARAPHIAAQWYKGKNRGATPETVLAGTHHKYWWKCERGHTWQAEVASRVANELGCPYCGHKRSTFASSLAVRAPEIAAQWHPTKNGTLFPHEVLVKSNKKVWWKCPEADDHEWIASIGSRTDPRNESVSCPFCDNRKLAPSTTLAARFPEIAAEWHPTKNLLGPDQVNYRSMARAHWRCAEGHEWSTRIHQRTQIGTRCPYCAGRHATPERSLATEAPKVARRWHPTKNGTLTPRDVLPGSSRKVWWKCPRGDDHEWQDTVQNRVIAGPGSCPFCIGRRLCKDNSLAARNPRIAGEWHPTKNGKLGPRDVTFCSSRRAWWRCVAGHEWQVSIGKRTRNDSHCPHCRRRKQAAATKGARRREVLLASYEGPHHGPVRRGK